MNTSRLNTCYTAGQFARCYADLLAEGKDLYGNGTREFLAFKTLLDHDAEKLVNAQVRHLTELQARYSRECADWIGQMPVTPGTPGHG